MTVTSKYWCKESLLVTVNGPAGRFTVAVNKPYARIGNHPRSEVVLAGDGIDARCFYLHATSEGVFCVHLSATSKMTLGSGNWLGPEEALQVGPYKISAQLQGSERRSAPRAALTAWGSAAPPLPVCEIFSNNKIRDKRRFRARLNLVGRRRELALQMQGQQVSSCHCALYWEAGRLWCIDLLSSNGTQLNDVSIDCALLEIGQSLQIGEFSLLLKRLSRATVRQSAWRTGESDDDVLAEPAPSLDADPSPGSMDQTITASNGDTGVPPSAGTPTLVPESNKVALSRRLHVDAQGEWRRDQGKVQAGLTARSEQVIGQREQLELQWQQASSEIASQVSQLQSESALLAAQRQAMAKLRADWDEQHRLLTEDLKNWREELSQRHALLEKQERVFPDADAPGALPASEGVEPDTTDRMDSDGGSFQSDSELTISALAGSAAPRGPLPKQTTFRTVIEGSYVVEKENPRTDFAARRAPFESGPPRSAVQPFGRRNSSESVPAAPAPDHPESVPDGASLVSPVSGTEAQALSVVEPTASGTALSLGDNTNRKVTGRRKQADDDRMGAFVTDRLVLREEARRLWLRLLWGVAAAISLLALATLGYIVLTHSG